MLLTARAGCLRAVLAAGSKSSCRDGASRRPRAACRRARRSLGTASCALLLAGGMAGPAGADALASHRCHHAGTEVAALGPGHGAERARTAASRALRCVVGRLRARHRLAPLRWSPRLAHAAQRHARDMVRRRYFSHTTPEGGELLDRLRGYADPAPAWWIGEVLAWGEGPWSRPIDVLRRWLDSPSHRRILLTPRAREIGIGIAFGAPVRRAADGSATFVAELGWRSP
jgi:uncharacterized protein YkwD